MPIQYIGVSNLIATNGGAPGAITPHANTLGSDLLIFYHYSRNVNGGAQTVTLPSGFGTVSNALTTSRGLVAIGSRFHVTGTTYTASVSGHLSSTTGSTILEWIETYRGVDPINPVGSVLPANANWASATNLGPIGSPSPSLGHGSWVVYFGGRMENITGSTNASGDNLTWYGTTINNSSLGTDAAALTQIGANNSGTSQTITSKTIATTGTAQTGAGRSFVINPLNRKYNL